MTLEQQKKQNDLSTRIGKLVEEELARLAAMSPEEKKRYAERGREQMKRTKERFAHIDKLTALVETLFDEKGRSDEPFFKKRHQAVRNTIWEELLRFFKGELFYDKAEVKGRLMNVIHSACRDGGAELEVKFVEQLLEKIQKRGEKIMYHPAFAKAFIADIQALPLEEIQHELSRVFNEQATSRAADIEYLAKVFIGNKMSGWDKLKAAEVAEWFEYNGPRMAAEDEAIVEQAQQVEDSAAVEQESETNQLEPHGLNLLQGAAKQPLGGDVVADPWPGLLSARYKVEDLDQLLVYVGLLETAKPRTLTAGTTPREWVALVHALIVAKKTKADRAALFRAFVARYGEAVGSLSSFSRGYNEMNEKAFRVFDRATSRLGVTVKENEVIHRKSTRKKPSKG